MRIKALPRGGVVVALLAAAGAIAGCSTQPALDLVIRGGTLYDGTGAPGGRRADVGIKGDRIVAIGDLSQRQTAETIDATGKVVAPGFIDAHGQSGVALLADGYGESHLRQGITSEIIADHSPAFWTMRTADSALAGRYAVSFDWTGLDGYFVKLESRGTAINIGTLVPTSLARAEGPGFVDAAMRAGALGVVSDDPDAGDVSAFVATAGQYNGVFMAPLGSGLPSADLLEAGATLSPGESAAKIIMEGARARAIVITELMAIAPPDAPSIAGVVQALASSGQHGAPVYGTIAPYADAGQSSDAPGRQMLGQWGGITIGTNSAAMVAGVAPASRAAFGAFPRLLGQWVRDDHVLTLAEAIRRITSVPASIFDIPMRGIIREQYFADLVVFDPATVNDRSSDSSPGEYPGGITHVIVNGVVTLAPGGLSGSRAGHRLRGFGARRRPS